MVYRREMKKEYDMEKITKAKKLLKQLRTEQIAELTRCFEESGKSEAKLRQMLEQLQRNEGRR